MGHEIGSAAWLKERFPDKDWHRHARLDRGYDLCDGTPSDCSSKARLPIDEQADETDSRVLAWRMKAADLANENERLRAIICNLHPDAVPDPLTVRIMREEVGEYEATLFCEIVKDNER